MQQADTQLVDQLIGCKGRGADPGAKPAGSTGDTDPPNVQGVHMRQPSRRPRGNRTSRLPGNNTREAIETATVQEPATQCPGDEPEPHQGETKVREMTGTVSIVAN